MHDAREVVRRVIERAEAAELECPGYISWLKNDEFGGIEKQAGQLLEGYDPEKAAHLLYLLTMEAYIRHAKRGHSDHA